MTKQKNNNTDLSVIIAFTVPIFLCVLRFFDQKQNEEQQLRKNHPVSTSLSLGEEKDTKVLLLVINAGKNEIIQSLENGRFITIDPDALYRATQALWMGSKADFFESELDNWFLNKPTVSKSESEYDVYFVQIELRKYDSGFDSNADQISRIDAFHRLLDNAVNIKVSDRLPSKAYENRFLYSR